MEVINFWQHKGSCVQGLRYAHLTVLLWHLDSDQVTLRQNRRLQHVVSEENPPHSLRSSSDKCRGHLARRPDEEDHHRVLVAMRNQPTG